MHKQHSLAYGKHSSRRSTNIADQKSQQLWLAIVFVSPALLLFPASIPSCEISRVPPTMVSLIALQNHLDGTPLDLPKV